MKIYIIFILALSLFSCTGNKGKHSDIKKIAIDPTNISPFIINQNFKVLNATRLKGSESAFIGTIDGMIWTDDKYFILDKTTKSVFVFSSDGDVISSLNTIGRGPKEYLDLSSFSVDTINEEIYLIDNISLKTLIVDYSGNYKKTIKNDYSIKDIVFNKSNKILIKDKVNSTSPDGFIINIYSEDKLKEQLVPFHYKQGENIFDYYYPVRVVSDSLLFYHTMFNDTLFVVSGNNISPRFIIDFEKERIPKDIYNKASSEIGRFMVINKWKYAVNPYVLDIFNNKLLFTYTHKAKALYCLYDMENDSYDIADFMFGENFPMSDLCSAPFYNNKEFVFHIDQYKYDALNDSQKKILAHDYPDLYKTLSAGSTNDNPIVIKVK